MHGSSVQVRTLTGVASRVVSPGVTGICNSDFAAAHPIGFASIIGQCQDLHGQGFGRHAADQVHGDVVSCISSAQRHGGTVL